MIIYVIYYLYIKLYYLNKCIELVYKLLNKWVCLIVCLIMSLFSGFYKPEKNKLLIARFAFN